MMLPVLNIRCCFGHGWVADTVLLLLAGCFVVVFAMISGCFSLGLG